MRIIYIRCNVFAERKQSQQAVKMMFWPRHLREREKEKKHFVHPILAIISDVVQEAAAYYPDRFKVACQWPSLMLC